MLISSGYLNLHQLRGRVGRGDKQSYCILMFKSNLSKNSVKRLKILKQSDDGFFIADQDLKLRGFGDLTGFNKVVYKILDLQNPVN